MPEMDGTNGLNIVPSTNSTSTSTTSTSLPAMSQNSISYTSVTNNNNNDLINNNNNNSIVNNNNNGGDPCKSTIDKSSPNNKQNAQNLADYLSQLLKDKKQLAAFQPPLFTHVERLLDEEISRVRSNLFQIGNGVAKPMMLPEPEGQVTVRTEKVYVPVKEHPEFNFVGRILGPRGMTAKQLEQETGCKIMVRGRGSMRDKKKEEANRGKPNWEHLNDDLHVLITCEDTPNRAAIKLEAAIEGVKKLLDVTEGEDELKKRQLMELAILNGTYRDGTQKDAKKKFTENDQFAAAQFLRGHTFNQATQFALQPTLSRAVSNASAQQIGAPLIISRGHIPMSMATAFNGTQLPPLINPQDPASNLFSYPTGFPSPYDYGLASLLPEYAVPVSSAHEGIATSGNLPFIIR